MKILQVANFVTPTSGGQRRTLLELGERYVACGHSCTLLTPGPTAPVVPTDHRPGGAAIEALQLPGVRVPGAGGYRAILRRRPVRAAVRALRPDVIELSDKTSLSWLPAWAAGEGIPTVLLAHDRHDAMLAGRLPGWLPWRAGVDTMVARAARGSAAVVCASRYSAEPFDRLGVPVRRVPLGVDLDTFRPPVRLPSRFPRRIALAFSGRLSPEKQPELAVAVVRELVRRGRDVSLDVLGDGPLRAGLEAAAAGLPVTFAGHVADRVELAARLGAADVLVAPCATETFGLAVLEALACGTPVVVPRAGAARELLVPGAGLAVEAEARAMANAVLRLAGADRAELRVRCRTRAEEFGWDRAAAAMLDLFASATSGAPVARSAGRAGGT